MKMPSFKSLNNCNGFAMLYVIILFALIGLLISTGIKKIGSSVALVKNNDTKAALERTEMSVIAWSARNGRLPTFTEYSSTFGSTPSDVWGKPLVFAYYSSLTHFDSVCTSTNTLISYNGQAVAFILLSGGDDYAVNSSLTSGILAVSPLTPSSQDMFRVVTVEELKIRSGCYGAR